MASISVSSAFSRCCASLAASLGSIAAKSYERGKTAIHESERGLVPTAGYGVNAWPSRKHNITAVQHTPACVIALRAPCDWSCVLGPQPSMELELCSTSVRSGSGHGLWLWRGGRRAPLPHQGPFSMPTSSLTRYTGRLRTPERKPAHNNVLTNTHTALRQPEPLTASQNWRRPLQPIMRRRATRRRDSLNLPGSAR